MAQIIKVDFSKEGKELRKRLSDVEDMRKQRKDDDITEIEKIGYLFQQQAGIRH